MFLLLPSSLRKTQPVCSHHQKLPSLFLLLLTILACLAVPIQSFSPTPSTARGTTTFIHRATIEMEDAAKNDNGTPPSNHGQVVPEQSQERHPFCDLPGDPSLLLTTNVDLGSKKLEIMKAMSKAIASSTGKPESYVAVSITDNASVIFGGSDAPTALGCLYSIGAIGVESNGAITNAVTDLLAEFNVAENRIYINFFDMPRANVGWSRRTFGG
ncbi:hypothetical protein ACA910_008731 [Epithemia clementina (nom. ined.)]